MNKGLMVTKRDGTLEQINLDKIHRVITWAAEGLENVSVSQVELRSHIQFYEGIRTSDIHETIIKAAAPPATAAAQPCNIIDVPSMKANFLNWVSFILIISLFIKMSWVN